MKINMFGNFFTNGVASTKPPRPGRPSSGKFQNRGSGKLFPVTHPDRLLNEEQDHTSNSATVINGDRQTDNNNLALVVHPDFQKEDDEPKPNSKSHPRYQRQTKSAKARTRPKSATISDSKRLVQRPQSAGNVRNKVPVQATTDRAGSPATVINLGKIIIPELFEIQKEKILALPEPKDCRTNNDLPPMHFTRPSSAKCGSPYNDLYFCKKAKMRTEDALKPSIYGLRQQRHFYGSVPDLSSANYNMDQFPYKVSNDAESKDDNKYRDNFLTRSTPSTLEPLMPWLLKDVPEDVIGVDPSQCLVFLAPVDWSELPEVPDEIKEDDDLPFEKDVTTPKPWNPKKYPHPFFNKPPVEEWVCNHNSANTDGEGNDTIYRKETKKRHMLRLPRMRTADVVKEEIRELENLIKGVGKKDSDCSLVKYQSEIDDFKDSLHDTLKLVPERLKHSQQHTDTFGLRKMCSDHDEFIEVLGRKVQECRAELADLELEAGIKTDRRHFSDFTRQNSTNTDGEVANQSAGSGGQTLPLCQPVFGKTKTTDKS